MLAAATPHAIAITSVMPKLIDEDGRGLLCLAQESPGLALGIIAVQSSLPAPFLYQRKHRVDRWCCDFDEVAYFLDGGDECIDLQGSASFEILQHRDFVADDGTGRGQAPLHHLFWNGETECCSDRSGFGHHGFA